MRLRQQSQVKQKQINKIRHIMTMRTSPVFINNTARIVPKNFVLFLFDLEKQN